MTNIVALFDSRESAQDAVRRLIDAGVTSEKISVATAGDGDKLEQTMVESDGNLAAEGAAAGISSGTLVGGALGLLAGLGLGSVVFGPLVLAGPIAGLLGGAAAGAATGGILGGLLGLGIPEEEAHTYAEGIRRGGTLVTAEVDDANADRISGVLDSAGAIDIGRRSEEYRSAGFERYDPAHPVYTAEEQAAERLRVQAGGTSPAEAGFEDPPAAPRSRRYPSSR